MALARQSFDELEARLADWEGIRPGLYGVVGEHTHRLNTLEDQVDDLEGGRCRCAEVQREVPSRVGSPGLSAVGGDRMSPTLLASEEEAGEMDLEVWADEWAVEHALLGEDAIRNEAARQEEYEEAWAAEEEAERLAVEDAIANPTPMDAGREEESPPSTVTSSFFHE